MSVIAGMGKNNNNKNNKIEKDWEIVLKQMFSGVEWLLSV